MNHPSTLRRTACRLTPLVLALVTACATHDPVAKPEPNLAQGWPVAADSSTKDASKVQWQAYFTDPRLQALIRLALANNRDLRIAASKVDQDSARYKTARADRLPSLDLQGSETRTSTPADLNTGVSPKEFSLQATLSYEVDFWGRVAAMTESAKANFLATEGARREVYLSLISDVASAYYALLEKEELLALARATLVSREQSLEIVTRGVEAGGAEDDERQQARAMVEGARAQLAQITHLRNMALSQLNFLVGAPASDLPPGRSLAEQEPGVALQPGLPSEVLVHRPDVMAAEQRLVAANADVDAARAAFMPRVSLTAALGFASPALASLFSGGAWNYEPLVTMPLFDGGRTQANADLARARKVAAVADYEKTLQRAFKDVADQLSARGSLKLQLEATVAAEHIEAGRLRMAQARFEAGICSYRDVLDSQRALLVATQSTIELRRAEQDAAATLYKVLGGGTDTEQQAVNVALKAASGQADR